MADHTDRDAVKAWLRLPPEDTTDDVILDEAVAAVNAFVTDLPHIGETVTERSRMGATMLAARYYRRRNSPAGIDGFGPDGAVYVPRRDSDVDQMLRIGSAEHPQVG